MAEPLLRWAGSKRRLLPLLAQATPGSFSRYVEPFAGSAVLFATLMPARALLGDLNPELMSAYAQLREHPRAIWNRVSRMSLEPAFYYELRAIDPSSLGHLDRAARFVYLNRFCFNGVYRTNKEGGFNVARGYGRLKIPPLKQFLQFARLLADAELRCDDFESIVQRARGGDFIYLDPPYALAGQRDRGEYGCDAFREDDEPRLVRSLRAASRRGAKILLSYSPSRSVIDGLSGWKVHDLTVARNVAGFAGARRKAQEILVSNYDW